jgi:DNA-binding MarR family transcriptional regulator
MRKIRRKIMSKNNMGTLVENLVVLNITLQMYMNLTKTSLNSPKYSEKQIKVLMVSFFIPNLMEKDIIRLLGLPISSTSNNLNQFLKDGLISISKEKDQRCKVIRITKRGEEILDRYFSRLTNRTEELSLGMSSQELSEITTGVVNLRALITKKFNEMVFEPPV